MNRSIITFILKLKFKAFNPSPKIEENSLKKYLQTPKLKYEILKKENKHFEEDNPSL